MKFRWRFRGFNKEDLNENRLTVSGARKFTKEKKERFTCVETQYGNSSRSFVLPENVDAGKINAAYNNGILEINIPKDEKKY